MSDHGKNILIGVFILSALSIIVWAVLFLQPTVGNGKETLRVRFVGIDNISIGTRVTFAGNPVGEVVAIQQIPDARTLPPHNGYLYFYEVTMAIDSSIQVYDTDEVSVATTGLFGERTIAITPKPVPKGVTAHLVHNQTLYAHPIDRLEEVFTELSTLGQKISALIDDNREALHKALVSVGDTFAELKGDLQQLSDKDFWNSLSATFANAKAITHEIAAGKGTIGHLVNSDDVYLRFVSVLDKGEILLNDINHYGLLFHLNKSWQRLRTQRMAMLERVDSPSSFKDYFNQEVDEISTAIARISLLMEKAQEEHSTSKLLQDPQFTKEFAELLHRIDDLQEQMRLYNQQLIDRQLPR